MDNFYKLTNIPIGLNDLKGNVLIGVGWQDICTRFHRVHPETCKHCIASDIMLSSGVSPGKFKMYRCRNNMWDIVTPIMVGGHHIGNIFSGQFFFEDEPLDYGLSGLKPENMASMKRKYSSSYKVPRLSREAVNTGMAFLMGFANMLSELSFSNIRLSMALMERNNLVNELQKNRKIWTAPRQLEISEAGVLMCVKMN